MSQWSEILSPEQIEARKALTVTLDAGFARRQDEFYLSRTEVELKAFIAQAWNANDADGYQMARSYLRWRFPNLENAEAA